MLVFLLLWVLGLEDRHFLTFWLIPWKGRKRAAAKLCPGGLQGALGEVVLLLLPTFRCVQKLRLLQGHPKFLKLGAPLSRSLYNKDCSMLRPILGPLIFRDYQIDNSLTCGVQVFKGAVLLHPMISGLGLSRVHNMWAICILHGAF